MLKDLISSFQSALARAHQVYANAALQVQQQIQPPQEFRPLHLASLSNRPQEIPTFDRYGNELVFDETGRVVMSDEEIAREKTRVWKVDALLKFGMT